jgi:hypothetical protein
MDRLDNTPVISNFLPAKKPVFEGMGQLRAENEAELSHAREG